MSSWFSPFGPGLALRLEEKSRRYYRFLITWWKFKRVEGFSTIAERIRRRAADEESTQAGDEAI